jgi:anamorsin
MDEIFARAKSILVIWADDVDPENLPTFQDTVQTKAKQAQIAFENVQMLFESRRATSSFDVILFGLVSKRDSPINLDLLNEFFRLLRPNGHLITHIEHVKQSQVVDHFKMCGFTSCNPLDSNSSFLLQNKDEAVKKQGSLWLCQKPSFDIGYSVPLRNIGQSNSTTNGATKKTWTMDDDDLIDTDALLDDNDRKKPDVKSNDWFFKKDLFIYFDLEYDCGTTSTGVRKACKNCTCGLAQELEQEEHAAAKATVKSACGSVSH